MTDPSPLRVVDLPSSPPETVTSLLRDDDDIPILRESEEDDGHLGAEPRGQCEVDEPGQESEVREDAIHGDEHEEEQAHDRGQEGNPEGRRSGHPRERVEDAGEDMTEREARQQHGNTYVQKEETPKKENSQKKMTNPAFSQDERCGVTTMR